MSLFTTPTNSQGRDRLPRRLRVGWTLVLVAAAAIVAFSFLPTPYVIQQPGPVFDTLGTVEIDDKEVPLIDIDAETYPTDGSLDMLTVSVVGSRETRPNWFSVAQAWFDSSKAVLPLDSMYPQGVTLEQSREESRIEMENSQHDAVAAALRQLGYDVPTTLTIATVEEGYPAEGLLEVGDQIVTVNGESFADVASMREELADNGTESPATIEVVRDGEAKTFEVTPVPSELTGVPIVGVAVQVSYELPVDVTIRLDKVGGPSAGLMFALGIYDKLTPGDETGGESIAGTGTITGTGEVGAIGGVRQKMYGALKAGADWMLVPASNCADVAGNEPDGLSVFAVATLAEALTALEGISGGSTDDLQTCDAVAAAAAR
ncbi:YlbL family protein [Salinibacterium hongtaonis]|uniref:YlbL family protein n=1 Tax=Homoserinimonas hongtaonis TaxID=2079791 RepID=UPI000D3A07AC|nr:S16 family serine protease [Salinibacterium hongtaonis]AWB88712.1 ATP-dependent serine peptidase containing a PDZ domain protein [Salinibacterium hongtaonis]